MDEADAVPPEEEPALIHGAVSGLSCGQLVVYPDRDLYVDMVGFLYDDGYRMCVDLTGVDYLFDLDRPLPAGVTPERFEVVVNLLSTETRQRIRLRVQIPEEDLTLPSIFLLHPGTEAMERETYDMFGIVFTGHPDLSRILMPDDWEGHPLRKDFGVGRIPVQFKGAPPAR
ncbi:MAG TPA: NADH-quinone oxidoreductase subunit C [Acidimicrobiales bacterium]|nr:NADH-quinone oxidoreductase subunit C [Acidimicrobiales bacterium]